MVTIVKKIVLFYFCLKSTTFIVALGERHYYLHRRYKTIWLNVIFSRKYRARFSKLCYALPFVYNI